MKTRVFKLLFPVLLVSSFYVMAPAVTQAQAPPPPPPPAKDYFPDKWDEYSSKTGKFRIRFPKQPQEAVNMQEELEVSSLEYKGLINYRVSSVDYKTPIDDPQKVKPMLQGLKTSALNSLKDKGLTVVAEREVTVDGHSGIFIHVELQGREVWRVQWVVAGSRLYTIITSSRKGSPEELEGKDDFEKISMGFINSFHVVP
jgi:hypothetical protein